MHNQISRLGFQQPQKELQKGSFCKPIECINLNSNISFKLLSNVVNAILCYSSKTCFKVILDRVKEKFYPSSSLLLEW